MRAAIVLPGHSHWRYQATPYRGKALLLIAEMSSPRRLDIGGLGGNRRDVDLLVADLFFARLPGRLIRWFSSGLKIANPNSPTLGGQEGGDHTA
jgi:hypothetical protein